MAHTPTWMEGLDLKYAASVLAVVGFIVVALQTMHAEVRTCRGVLEGLAHGSPGVQGRVAWERLHAIGVDVGSTYTKLPNDAERARYRRAFIEQFAHGFAGSGARTGDFVHWRVVERRPESVVVAADYPAKGKTLLMTVSSTWRGRVQAIEWQE